MENDHELITKELRAIMHPLGPLTPIDGKGQMLVVKQSDFVNLCDRIDNIHYSLEVKNESMRKAQDDQIKLPVDADKAAIHEGDELWSDNGIWVKVERLQFENGKWAVFVEDKRGIGFYAAFERMHHYCPDTWESIIEDAVKLGFTDPDNEHLADKLVARCKALCECTGEGEE